LELRNTGSEVQEMSEIKLKVLIFSGLGGVFFLTGLVTVLLALSSSRTRREEVRVYSVGELLTEFEIDKGSAKRRFMGKMIDISGVVDSVRRTEGGVWIFFREQGEKKSELYLIASFRIPFHEAPSRGRRITFVGVPDHVQDVVGRDNFGAIFIGHGQIYSID
jgi:hypothetical protein